MRLDKAALAALPKKTTVSALCGITVAYENAHDVICWESRRLALKRRRLPQSRLSTAHLNSCRVLQQPG